MILKIIHFLKAKCFNYLKSTIGNNEWIWPKYRVPSLRNINSWDNVEYKSPFLKIGTSTSYELLEFLLDISEKLNKNESFTLIRMGDGEMLYLQGKIIGNLIKRHKVPLDIEVDKINIVREKMKYNDYILFFQNPSMLKLLPKDCYSILKRPKYDLYLIYQLISSKLLFYILSGKKIGIIGAKEKVSLIQTLMTYDEYKTNMSIKEIYEYININQIGAGGDYLKTLAIIDEQITLEADVYLVGIGISKLYVLPELKDKYGKVFIDVGAGIDALAGIIPNTRSYFANWTNYRLRKYDYSNVDILSYQKDVKNKIENIKYLDEK